MGVLQKRSLLLIAAAVFFCLYGLVCHAETAEKQYIAYLQREAELLTTEQKPNFIVVSEEKLLQLQADGKIAWYEEDYEVELLSEAMISDTYYSYKWDLHMVNAEAAWENGCFGEDIRIAVIDSGVNMHDDLHNNVLPGKCYTDDTDSVTDNIGHGTFVSGLIAAEKNSIGIVGVAPEAKIVPLKCFDNDFKTTVSVLVQAIYDAVDVYGCRIINMSLGLTSDSTTLKSAIDYATAKSCIVVAAVGNAGSTKLYYPAAYANVIGVGAVDSQKIGASFSQRNQSVLLVAPGKQVLSTDKDGGYAYNDGTSFSTPIVAGAVAVLLNLDPTLDGNGFMDLFQRCSDDLGIVGPDTRYGYGLLNIKRCVNSILQIPGDIDNDGRISVADALHLLRSLLNRDDSVSLSVADMSGDGELTLLDVIRVLKSIE